MPVKASRERVRVARTLASAQRFSPDAESTEDLKRELKAMTIEDHIRALADSAPPLTMEQRNRLALLLRGGANR